MLITRSPEKLRLETLEAWRAAARLVSTRWQTFVGAEPEMRIFAFASYLAALDGEESAAAHLALLARATAAEDRRVIPA